MTHARPSNRTVVADAERRRKTKLRARQVVASVLSTACSSSFETDNFAPSQSVGLPFLVSCDANFSTRTAAIIGKIASSAERS